MAILIIAEHDNRSLKTATLNTVTAASQMGEELHLLLAGCNCKVIATRAAEIEGVAKVLLADATTYEHHLAENMAQLILELAPGYSHIVAPASSSGKDILPRVAARLNVAQISDITAVESADTFQRPIYAGNAIATVQSLDPIKVITVRSSAFTEAEASADSPAPIHELHAFHDARLSEYVRCELVESERPELTSAPVVISGGRGMGNGENFRLLEQVADKLGAAVGASRAAVDAGFAPNDMQVGQTGKIVAPELYIAVGISGAIQHLAGMKDSGVIVAINKDEEAPIFSVADYGLVGDLFELIPELQQKL
ncbi:electron transfer flavoprotein subunit alpha/FixB family protein [Neptuniibacter halophilus]|uniref:electron transfer flavoprotein subunit alpha/FixB family protein n=1 Tax=Neptuniibacter halophilus TaxID=651666 RepID=UPI00257316FA|nr:FAD-binding protein [Neptuniibacter halophilus]